MLAVNGGNDEVHGLLGADLELVDKRQFVPWIFMSFTGLTWLGMICGGAFLWQADLHRGYINEKGTLLVALGGSLAVGWLGLAIRFALEVSDARTVEAHVRQNPQEVFRMVLSGRVVASYMRMVSLGRAAANERQLQQRRKRFRAYFPWVELLLASLVALWGFGGFIFGHTSAAKQKYASSAAIIGGSMLLGSFAIRLLLRFGPSLESYQQGLQHLDLSERPGTKETFVLALQRPSQVAVSFHGRLTTFRNVGQLPPHPLLPQHNSTDNFLGKSQLVAHYSDGQIDGWYLKVISARREGTSWRIMSDSFPVEVSKVQELYQWLASEPRATLFRFCGNTHTAPELQPTREVLTGPRHVFDGAGLMVPVMSLMRFPVDERPAMVLTAALSCGQAGAVHVSLLSMAGNELEVVQLKSTDTIADLWWEIDSHVLFAGKRVALMLDNGRSLDDTQTYPMQLAELMQAGSPSVELQPPIDV